MQKVRTAVIPAAGLGTRFWPATKGQPKEMLLLADMPVIHYVVEEAVASGLDRILIVVGKGKESIINYFDSHHLDTKRGQKFGFDKLPEIFFVRQKEQKGLADAVRYGRRFTCDEPFVVLLGDTVYTTSNGIPVTAQLVQAYEKVSATTIAIEKVLREKIQDYGIVSGERVEDGLWRISDLVEKPKPEDAPSDLGITGTYVLTPEIYGCIDQVKPGKNGELQLTDALKLLRKTASLYGAEFKGTRYDIGTKVLWKQADMVFSRMNPEFAHLYPPA